MFHRREGYVFNLDERKPRWETRTHLCAEIHGSRGGDSYIRFWIEKHHPEKIGPRGRLTPERVETISGPYFSTYTDILDHPDRRDLRDGWGDIRFLMNALAAGNITGRSEGEAVWSVFWRVAIRNPEADLRWLQKGAPEWLALIHPDTRPGAEKAKAKA